MTSPILSGFLVVANSVRLAVPVFGLVFDTVSLLMRVDLLVEVNLMGKILPIQA